MGNKINKPMLLSNDEFDIESLDYSEMYISPKYDGIRAVITNEGIKNRSLKTLRNTRIQEHFKSLCDSIPEGFTIEGEIYAESTPCRTMAGICNSLDHDVPLDTQLYLFGVVDDELTFNERQIVLNSFAQQQFAGRFNIVTQVKVESHEEATSMYEHFLDQGFEGAVLMDGRKLYKHGRVTIRQHIGFKMKPFREDDLKIVGVTERFKNLNDSQTNELGRSYRRNTVDAKEPTGIAATFDCLLPNGETTKVSIGGSEESRRLIWETQDSYIGAYAVVKSMDYGTKTKLRHPNLIKVKGMVEK